MKSVEVKFLPKDRVHVDGDKSLTLTVIGIRIHPDSKPRYELEWFDGVVKCVLLDEFRLTPYSQ